MAAQTSRGDGAPAFGVMNTLAQSLRLGGWSLADLRRVADDPHRHAPKGNPHSAREWARSCSVYLSDLEDRRDAMAPARRAALLKGHAIVRAER